MRYTRRWRNVVARGWWNVSRTLRVDDIARHHLACREILFFVWVTLTEHKWVILAERRGLG